MFILSEWALREGFRTAPVDRITLQDEQRRKMNTIQCFLNGSLNPNGIREHHSSPRSHLLTYFARVRIVPSVYGRFVMIPRFWERQTAKPDLLWKINSTGGEGFRNQTICV